MLFFLKRSVYSISFDNKAYFLSLTVCTCENKLRRFEKNVVHYFFLSVLFSPLFWFFLKLFIFFRFKLKRFEKKIVHYFLSVFFSPLLIFLKAFHIFSFQIEKVWEKILFTSPFSVSFFLFSLLLFHCRDMSSLFICFFLQLIFLFVLFYWCDLCLTRSRPWNYVALYSCFIIYGSFSVEIIACQLLLIHVQKCFEIWSCWLLNPSVNSWLLTG